MLRQRVAAGDELGQAAEGIMKSGALVPDEMVNRMVEDRIGQPDAARGFILDGYPRTVSQASLLARALEAKRIRTVVVHLKVEYNEIIARLAGRRQCPACGALYSSTSNGPEVCSKDGSKLILRDDDQEDVVLRRLQEYERQTTPVLEFLKNSGFPCLVIEAGARTPDAIAQEIAAAVAVEQLGVKRA
jgi:adenylate kinase